MIHLPESTPEHLIKLQPTEAKQYAYCESIGCYYNCEHCVNYSESMPIPTNKPIKEKISQARLTPAKYDNLSKRIANKPKRARHEHPLFDYIIEKFTK